MSDEPTVPLANYTAALDEIYALRRALAYEARVTEAHYEGYKTFPKSRRKGRRGAGRSHAAGAHRRA